MKITYFITYFLCSPDFRKPYWSDRHVVITYAVWPTLMGKDNNKIKNPCFHKERKISQAKIHPRKRRAIMQSQTPNILPTQEKCTAAQNWAHHAYSDIAKIPNMAKLYEDFFCPIEILYKVGRTQELIERQVGNKLWLQFALYIYDLHC